MSSGGELSRAAYLAVGTPLITLCGGFVIIRCMMEIRKSKKLLIDDYLSIVGLVFVTTAFALNDIIIRRFTDPTAQLSWLVQIGVVITVIIAFALWTSKAPILLVYVRIFGIRKRLAYTCYATLICTALLYIGAMVPSFIRCKPGADPVTPEVLETCVSGTTLTGVISGFIALADDVIILVLPMPFIYSLHLAPSKKLAVGAVFSSGFCGIAASILSLYYKYRAYNGQRSDTLATMLCAVVEGTIALMVGCAPAIKLFWGTFISRPKFLTSPQRSMYPEVTRTKHSVYGDDNYILMDSPTRRHSAPMDDAAS